MSESDEISKEVKSFGQELVDLVVEEKPPFGYRWLYLTVALGSLESAQETISQQSLIFDKRKYYYVDQILNGNILTSFWTQDPIYG